MHSFSPLREESPDAPWLPPLLGAASLLLSLWCCWGPAAVMAAGPATLEGEEAG